MAQRPGVYDKVKVPKVPPGRYVLGFRYDCDATAQVGRTIHRPVAAKTLDTASPHRLAGVEQLCRHYYRVIAEKNCAGAYSN